MMNDRWAESFTFLIACDATEAFMQTRDIDSTDAVAEVACSASLTYM